MLDIKSTPQYDFIQYILILFVGITSFMRVIVSIVREEPILLSIVMASTLSVLAIYVFNRMIRNISYFEYSPSDVSFCHRDNCVGMVIFIAVLIFLNVDRIVSSGSIIMIAIWFIVGMVLIIIFSWGLSKCREEYKIQEILNVECITPPIDMWRFFKGTTMLRLQIRNGKCAKYVHVVIGSDKVKDFIRIYNGESR